MPARKTHYGPPSPYHYGAPTPAPGKPTNTYQIVAEHIRGEYRETFNDSTEEATTAREVLNRLATLLGDALERDDASFDRKGFMRDCFSNISVVQAGGT